MAITVFPCINRCKDSCLAGLTSDSNAQAASSSTKIGAFLSNTRAMATRWRCPPDNLTLRSPT